MVGARGFEPPTPSPPVLFSWFSDALRGPLMLDKAVVGTRFLAYGVCSCFLPLGRLVPSRCRHRPVLERSLVAERIRISKRTIDALRPRERAFIAYDDDLTGFAVRVSPAGGKTFLIEYRPGSGGRSVRSVRLSLGAYGVLTPDEARRLARDKLSAVRHGKDPAQHRRQDRETRTVEEVAELWMADAVAPKLATGTAGLYRLYLDKHVLPALGSRKISHVTGADLDRLHSTLGKAGKRAIANRIIATLSGLFTFAARRRLVPADFVNPAKGIEKFGEENRERYLSTAELQRLGTVLREAETIGLDWQAIEPGPRAKHAPKPENRREVYSPHVTGAIRLLLFTGCRLREILHLRWSEVDFERGLLFLTKSKTGRKTVVLNAPALAVLAELPKAGAYVIAGTDPAKPRTDLKKPWDRITRVAELPGLRIHDLRHSFASVGAGGGMGLPIVGKLLGHTQASTTARYAHVDADPLRRASERIGGAIAAALAGQPDARVTNLRKARGQ